MEEKKMSLVHCIFFVYNTFAQYTDGEFKQTEADTISFFMKRWLDNDEKILNQIVSETIDWSEKNIQNHQQAIEYMASMVEFIKSNEDFDIYKREHFLLDIRNIARADGEFHETEKTWHDVVAKQLELPIRISKSSINEIESQSRNLNKREPLGFKMSWQK
tara:strand:- start:3521 stop:4003 length:483 start_codon:yes stop_codon:yes gene_type:complete